MCADNIETFIDGYMFYETCGECIVNENKVKAKKCFTSTYGFTIKQNSLIKTIFFSNKRIT